MPTRRTLMARAAALATTALSTTVAPLIRAQAGENGTSGRASQQGPTEQTRSILRLAIIGTGQISTRYLSDAKLSTGARIVATCARTLQSAKSRAVEYGIDQWFDDYIKLFETAKPDAVIVATPTPTHATIAISALQRGIHVLCEKPMARTFGDCQAMVAASKKSGALLLVMPFEGNAQTRAAIDYLNEPTLGVFVGAQSEMVVPGMSRTDWYYDANVAGPAFGEMMVYPISALVNLLGPARRVTGFINTLIPHRITGTGDRIDFLPPPRDPAKGKTVKPTAADNATLILEWANGQHGIARGIWGTSFLDNATTIYGRHGTLWMSNKGFKRPEVVVHSPERPIDGATLVTGSYENCYRISIPKHTHEGLIDHFVDCVHRKAVPSCGAEQALHVHEILYKGAEASRTGKTQELATTFASWHKLDPKFLDTRSRPV